MGGMRHRGAGYTGDVRNGSAAGLSGVNLSVLDYDFVNAVRRRGLSARTLRLIQGQRARGGEAALPRLDFALTQTLSRPGEGFFFWS